jgi:hypothetical protein
MPTPIPVHHPATLQLGPLPERPGLPEGFVRLRPPRPGRPERHQDSAGHLIEAEGNQLRFLHYNLDDLAFLTALETEPKDCHCVQIFNAFQNRPFPPTDHDFYRFRTLTDWMVYSMAEAATEFLISKGFRIRLRRSDRTLHHGLYRVMHGPAVFRELYHHDHLNGILQCSGWPFIPGDEPFVPGRRGIQPEGLTLQNGICRLCGIKGLGGHLRTPEHYATLAPVCRAVPRLPFPTFQPITTEE